MFSMTSGDNENSNVSFLDQIKNRKKASADSETKPMSFLDQIKCRGKPQPDSQGEKENDPNVVEGKYYLILKQRKFYSKFIFVIAPKIISDSKPLGLLDAIKARRKD